MLTELSFGINMGLLHLTLVGEEKRKCLVVFFRDNHHIKLEAMSIVYILFIFAATAYTIQFSWDFIANSSNFQFCYAG